MREVLVNTALVKLRSNDAGVVHVIKKFGILLSGFIGQQTNAIVLDLSHSKQFVEFLDAV